jgi:hypothetical protein
MFQFA